MFQSVFSADRGTFIGGSFLCWSLVLIAGWRWHRLLGVFEIHVPLKSLICIAQIGQFFMMFLPGPAGDDLTRMLYISRIAKGRIGEACTSVVLDRLIGLTSILLLAVLCIPAQWRLLSVTPQTYWLGVVMMVAGSAVGIALLGYFFVSQSFVFRIVEGSLGCIFNSRLHGELMRITTLLSANRSSIAKVLGAAIGTQLLVCLLFSLAGSAVGIRVPLFAWFSFVPVLLAANAVPITIAGFGVREYLLVLFLGVLGHVERERALAASIVAFSMILVVSLIGGVVYIFYRPSRS